MRNRRKKSFLKIKNIDDIKMMKTDLREDILDQEEVLSESFNNIKSKWNIFGHQEDEVIDNINKVAGYVSTGVVVASKLIDVIGQIREIYKRFNNK